MTAGAAAWPDAIAFTVLAIVVSWIPLGILVLAIVVSWIPLGGLVLTGREPFADPVSTMLWAVGGYGPTVAALVAARALHGPGGLRRLGRDLRRWRVGRWYAVLLPRLQARTSALVASVTIGLVWSLWHAPLFLLGSTTQATTSPLWFTVQAIALSVILTWTYNGTGGSLLLAVLLHGALNGWYTAVVQGLAPTALDGFTAPAAVAMSAVAVWVIPRHGPRDLAQRPRRGWHSTPSNA